jgi:hypothetical protein
MSDEKETTYLQWDESGWHVVLRATGLACTGPHHRTQSGHDGVRVMFIVDTAPLCALCATVEPRARVALRIVAPVTVKTASASAAGVVKIILSRVARNVSAPRHKEIRILLSWEELALSDGPTEFAIHRDEILQGLPPGSTCTPYYCGDDALGIAVSYITV